MKSVASPFEVRCHRCNVTFPIGTRQCIHCGGRIDQDDQSGILESIHEVDPGRGGLSSKPIDVMADPGDSDEMDSDAPSSVGASLIRSLGGFIWVIVLIGFTLARSCGGE